MFMLQHEGDRNEIASRLLAFAAGASVAAILVVMSWGLDQPDDQEAWRGNSANLSGIAKIGDRK